MTKAELAQQIKDLTKERDTYKKAFHASERTIEGLVKRTEYCEDKHKA